MGDWPKGLLREDENGVILAVSVQPGAKRVRIEGIDIWRNRLHVAVKPPPQKGIANEAVRELLSSAFEIPIGQIEIISGTRSRHKSIRFSDSTLAEIQSLLEVIDAA